MNTLYAETVSVVTIEAVASQKYVEQKRAFFLKRLSTLRRDQFVAVMAYLNNICYFAAQYAIDDNLRVELDELYIVLAASDAGKLQVCLANKWQQRYNRKYWDEASSSAGAIRRVRSLLQDLGLLKFTPVEAGTTFAPPMLEAIDFQGCLIAYEAAEIICGGGYVDIREDVPEHKGAVMVALFNATFRGVAQYRRKNIGFKGNDEIAIEVIEPKWRSVPDAECWLKEYEPPFFSFEYWKERFLRCVRSKRKPKKEFKPIVPSIDPYLHQLIPY